MIDDYCSHLCEVCCKTCVWLLEHKVTALCVVLSCVHIQCVCVCVLLQFSK